MSTKIILSNVVGGLYKYSKAYRMCVTDPVMRITLILAGGLGSTDIMVLVSFIAVPKIVCILGES